MSYYDTKTKKWRAAPCFNNLRLPTKSFSTKTLADRYEQLVERQEEEKFVRGTQSQDYHYNEIHGIWFEDACLRKRDSSLEKDNQMHRDYVTPIIGDLKISQITAIHLNTIVARLLKKGLSKSSGNKVIQHIKAVFNYSFNHDLIARNPCKNFKQLKLDKKEMDFLELRELEQLLTYTDRRYVGEERWVHVFYLILFLTGARLGEILGLQWHRIYFDRNAILIANSWCSKKHILLNTTKGKKDRTVPLPTMLKTELASLRNSSKSPFVFSNVLDRPIDASNFRKRNWERDFEACEIRHIRIHDARHTYASLFMMNGGSLYDLKTVLGHADIKTTERYAHLSSSHLLGVKDIIQPIIGKKADVISVNDFKNKSAQPLSPKSVSDQEKNSLSING